MANNIIATPSLSLIADGFPPTLNTLTPATELQPNETPDGYGFDLEYQGLKKGTCPSGDAYSLRTINVGGQTYYYIYNRLLYASGRSIIYGALNYDDVYIPQREGVIRFDDDTENVATFVPIYPDVLLVTKNSSGYIVNNMVDSRNLWLISNKSIYLACSSYDYVGVIGENAYIVNNSGLIATDGRTIKELTIPIRNNLSYVTNAAMTIDYVRQWVIIGSKLVYDIVNNKIYRYVGNHFLYTSPQYHLPTYQPFTAKRLLFVYDILDDEDASLTYSIRYDDEDWGDDFEVVFKKQNSGSSVSQHEDLATPRSARTMQLRITDMSDNLLIKSIRHDETIQQYDDYVGNQ